jgi:hypothetical protein
LKAGRRVQLGLVEHKLKVDVCQRHQRPPVYRLCEICLVELEHVLHN